MGTRLCHSCCQFAANPGYPIDPAADAINHLWRVVQLALNAAWPFTFFAAHNRAAALTAIAALDITIAAEIVAAVRRDRPAAALLAPYLAWSLYATALTAAVNPETSQELELSPSADVAPLD